MGRGRSEPSAHAGVDPVPRPVGRGARARPRGGDDCLRGAAESDLWPLEAIATIDKPALVLSWADDPGHPEATAQWLAIKLPRATLVIARSLREVLAWKGEVRRFLNSL